MAKKTFRTIYINDELEELLQKRAEEEQSSISRLVRIALQKHLSAGTVKTEELRADNNQKSVVE
jgi:predicted transcriptional regulator